MMQSTCAEIRSIIGAMSDSTKPIPTPMPLPVPAATQAPTSAQRRKLRALAHHLRPVVLLGNKGLTAAVTTETDATLTSHELIKVRSAADGKSARKQELEQLATATGSHLVQQIGRIGVLYRPGDPPKIFAPKQAVD